MYARRPKESMQAVSVTVRVVALSNWRFAMSDTIIPIDLDRHNCVARVMQTGTRQAHSFPSTKSTTQQPRTCDPSPRQCARRCSFSHPAS